MKTIKLYGHLGKKFGKVHKLNVRTPAEAVRALCANFPDFKEQILKYNQPGYHVISSTGEDYAKTPESFNYPAEAEIKIIPVITGAGGGGIGTIILGVVLIAIAWWNPMSWGLIANSSTGLLAGELALSAMTYLGTALILTGVSQMLFAPPKVQTAQEVEQNASSYFNGPQNVSVQGNPVPLVYGRIMVGSQIISAELTSTKYIVPPVAKTLGAEIWVQEGKYNIIELEPYTKNNTTITTNSTADKFASSARQILTTRGLAYIRIGISGTDADGNVEGFILKTLPTTGTLKLENADGTVVTLGLNTKYYTRKLSSSEIQNISESNESNEATAVIGSLFSFRSLNNTTSITQGAILRWYPPSLNWTGTETFSYVVVDNDNVESKALTVNLEYNP